MRRIFLLVILLATSTAQGEIFKVKIDGVIDPITSEFITGAVEQAEEQEAEFLLIELSTPGGLGVSMQEIIQMILNSEVPVVCFVAPQGARAASAGFFILLSADLAVMAPGTNTGAAHPVFPFGGEDETMLEKVTNDALANLRAIVSQRERNYEMAEKGVVESKSYTAQEALEGGLIDLIVEDEEDLLKALDGREITLFSGELQRLETEGLCPLGVRYQAVGVWSLAGSHEVSEREAKLDCHGGVSIEVIEIGGQGLGSATQQVLRLVGDRSQTSHQKWAV